MGPAVHAQMRHQVSFQTVLVKPVKANDGEGDEQDVGFRGAFLQGIERVAPDREEEKGE